MEELTDYQLKSMLKMIKEILDGCETIEEAKEKIRKLIEE